MSDSVEFRADHKTSNLLSEGFVKVGNIAPVTLLHEGLLFEYRPMLGEEVLAVDDAQDRLREQGEPEKSLHLVCAAIAKHIAKWSETGPVSVDTVRRLPLPLIRRVHRIIAQTEPSDPQEGAPIGTHDSVSRLVDDLTREAKGVESDEEADAKN